MSDSTLLQIQRKVRRLSGSPSEAQLTTAELNEYIDTFYEQDMPSHLKVWNLHSTHEFFTTPNEDRYAFNTDLYFNVLPPVYIDGYQSFYSQSRKEFFRIYPKVSTTQTGPQGDGTAGAYSYTISSTPILRRNVTISTSGGQSVEDIPTTATAGNLVDTSDNTVVRGTIDYITGAVVITWGAIVPSTENIITSYVPYQASRPGGMLFFKDYFILRPVPDKVYRVVIEVYQKPTQLLSANSSDPTNTPDVQQWWQYIAFGAALKVLQDRQDMESIQNIIPFFKEQEALILYRTATQQAPERTATIYTDQLQLGVGNRPYGGS